MSESPRGSLSKEDFDALERYNEKLSEEILSRPISSMDLSDRAINTLSRKGVETIGQLVTCSDLDLLNVRNFGPLQIEEVKEKLSQLGLSLDGEYLDK